ncbi:MAG: TetR/AcrR family transcriptional regulator [Paracoccaceae bacterium]
MPAVPKRKAGPRDAERTRRAILDAALVEFSEKGHAAARMDAVAEAAGISKPMIYSYFGDKDALYAAALREAYVQIREGETELQPAISPRSKRCARWCISLSTTSVRSPGSSRCSTPRTCSAARPCARSPMSATSSRT